MAKREFIDRSLLDMPSDDNVWEELVKFADDVAYADAITEQDIVKPYLVKLIERIEEIEKAYGLDKATKYGNVDAEQQKISYSTMFKYEIADITDEIKDFIDNLLSAQGEKNE